MLPFPPYPILLITLNAMHVASSARIFFTFHRSQECFLDKFPLQEFFGEFSPHLRLFLMVRL